MIDVEAGARAMKTDSHPWASLAIATIVVAAAYGFFATAGTFEFRSGFVRDDYRELAEAFQHGQLSLIERPDPRLAKLANPYDFGQRWELTYRWDSSYYDGRYYLYFSPLPVLIVYLPWRVLTGEFPDPSLVIALLAFCAWLFQGAAFLLIAGRRVRGAALRIGCLLLLGLGNLVPYTLLRPEVYELAVMAGYMFSSAFICCAAWVWFRPPSRWAAALAGLTCGLSVAARPSLAPLLIPFFALGIVIWKRGSEGRLALLLCLAIPLVLSGGAMAWYNAARFGSVWEWGHSYMLTSTDNRAHQACAPLSPIGWVRMLNAGRQYLASVPRLSGLFPFLSPRPGVPLPSDAAALRLPYEGIAGLALLFPLFSLALVALPWTARRSMDRTTGSFVVVMAVCAAAVAALVGSCWWVTLRYELDFWPPLAMATILTVAHLVVAFDHRWLRAGVAAVSVYTLLVGLLLGMSGADELFRARNPRLLERLVGVLSPTALLEFPRPIGCYRWPFVDLDRRVYGRQVAASPDMTPEACNRRCRKSTARYAAVVDSVRCLCSNVLAHRGRSRVIAAGPGLAGWSEDFCARGCSEASDRDCRSYGTVFMLRP